MTKTAIYIYEVDLHYPTKLHNHHDDYPLAPESLVIFRTMYSPTQQSIFPESAPQKKLTRNLHDKTKYVVQLPQLKIIYPAWTCEYKGASSSHS